MAIPSKGSRNISVNNSKYRWLIRRKETYNQVDYGIGKIHVAIELINKPNNTLIIYTDRQHPHDIATNEIIPVTPSDISNWIKLAIELGWEPNKSGAQLHVRIQDGKMIRT